MPTSEITQIELLKQAQNIMTQDITEIKNDIKEIKTMLNSNFVTRTEYDQHNMDTNKALELARKSKNVQLLAATLITASITGLVSFLVFSFVGH